MFLALLLPLSALSVLVIADPEVERLKERVAQLEAEVQSLRERLKKVEALQQPKKPVTALQLSVIPGNWGDADLDDIQAVCLSAAKELLRYFPARDQDPITVRYDAKQGPMVVFGKGSAGERRVLLSVQDRYWSQFAYQFAHELCHIQCNYREGNKANLWFEESLCQMASLFVLRRMAETWKTNPPYTNWKSKTASLNDYSEQRLKATEQLDGLTLAQWYQRNEAELSKTGVNRKKNQVIAAALLPLFEKHPEQWQAVRYLNQWDREQQLNFPAYLRDWHTRVPAEQKPFVEEIAALFEVSLK